MQDFTFILLEVVVLLVITSVSYILRATTNLEASQASLFLRDRLFNLFLVGFDPDMFPYTGLSGYKIQVPIQRVDPCCRR